MIELTLARPLKEDAEYIFDLRRDPVVEAASYGKFSDSLDEFFPVYLSYFNHYAPLFIHWKGDRVGFIKFRKTQTDRTCNAAEISIAIEKEKRGMGIALKALRIVEDWLKSQNVTELVAEIKEENYPSIKLFEKAGYELDKDFIKIVQKSLERCRVKSFVLKLNSEVSSPLYVIAEAGSNWKCRSESESFGRAIELIENAKEAGADAVKFQLFRAETTYVPNPGSADYLSKEGRGEDIAALFKELEMPYEMIAHLAEHARSLNIDWMCSVFSVEDFEVVDPFVERHKLASYELSHPLLIEKIAKSGKPAYFSTGASSLDEIERAVDYYRQMGGHDVTLMQCTAAYPAPEEALNLRAIESLGEMVQVPVGLSDHSTDPYLAPLLALGQGAVAIEKHFTLDRTLDGPDHAFAIEPHELKQLVHQLRRAEKAMGNGIKTVELAEEELADFAKRGIQATDHISKGDALHMGKNFDILRPGKQQKGANPLYFTQIEGKRAKRNFVTGEGIDVNDIK